MTARLRSGTWILLVLRRGPIKDIDPHCSYVKLQHVLSFTAFPGRTGPRGGDFSVAQVLFACVRQTQTAQRENPESGSPGSGFERRRCVFGDTAADQTRLQSFPQAEQCMHIWHVGVKRLFLCHRVIILLTSPLSLLLLTAPQPQQSPSVLPSLSRSHSFTSVLPSPLLLSRIVKWTYEQANSHNRGLTEANFSSRSSYLPPSLLFHEV